MKHAFLALPMVLALGAHRPIAPAKPVFSAALFAPLATANPDAQKRWQWPATEAFHETWLHGERAARPIRLVRGSVGKFSDIVIALTPKNATEYEAGVVFATGVDDYEARGAVPEADAWIVEGELAAGKLVLKSGSQKVVIDATYVSPLLPPSADPFADWIYVTTLLASDEAIYEPAEYERSRDPKLEKEWTALENEIKADPKAALARIESLVSRKASPYEYRWGSAVAFAAKHDKELARRAYRVYRPMGQCAMDTRPAEVAREYAQLCYEMGKLGCYLQLSVQIMGNQFDRMSWGSYAEPVHVTHAEKLGESGLDVDRFLLGLATIYGTEKPRERELGVWRLARSIRESGREATVKPELEKRAQDATLDEMNRLRATIVLAWIDESPQRGLDEAARTKLVTDRKTRFETLAKLDLSPISRAWLEQQIASL